jgi:L-lysine exporter family protein LysE/ArgO
MELAFVKGFATSAALIVAIGAQNAFVLRQGLQREHVLAVVLVCALSDVLLISVGVAGLGTLVQGSPLLLALTRWGGALSAQRSGPTSLRAAITACLAFTYLNPHCWLDTVVLLGSISGQQPDSQRWWFGAGACCASVAWFFALGYGARLLAPVFERPLAWRVLDSTIAAVMWSIAASLALSG